MLIGYVIDQDYYHSECVTLTDEEEQVAGAIFDNQDEWDCYPTCEICRLEIDDVQLTSDGLKWLHSTGRKQDWESWSDAFREVGGEFYYAYASQGEYYCLDCYIEKVLLDNKDAIQAFYQSMKNDNLDIEGAITETTVQYEQWTGELIPVDGVYCTVCGDELYAPYEEEDLPEEEREDPDAARITHWERM